MKTTSKKLFVSVFALLFAVVAVATTSFAWFTISGKARVEEFQLDITTGEGIEIQLTLIGEEPTQLAVPGKTTGWKNVITLADFKAVLTHYDFDEGGEIGEFKLEHLTSTDAVTFKHLAEQEDGTYKEADLPSGSNLDELLLQFDLHFRANEGYQVKLTSDSQVSSGESTLSPAWTETTYTAFAANAARVGFVPYTVYGVPVGEDPAPVLVSYGDTNIWAPTDPASSYETNRPYGDKSTGGAYEFFNAYMNAVKETEEPVDYLPEVPSTANQTVFGTGGVGDKVEDKVLLTLSNISAAAATTPFSHYGKMSVRIWLEGWDGDCFNVLYAKNFKTILAFEGVTA